MHYLKQIAAGVSFISLLFAADCLSAHAADAPTPKGFSSFGPDQTITDINKVEWQPAFRRKPVSPVLRSAPEDGMKDREQPAPNVLDQLRLRDHSVEPPFESVAYPAFVQSTDANGNDLRIGAAPSSFADLFDQRQWN
jgi:hypothetical protein